MSLIHTQQLCVSSVGPSGSKLESDAHYTLVLGEGDYVEVGNTGSEKLHFVLIAGQPLNEPVVQHGKFHMNSLQN